MPVFYPRLPVLLQIINFAVSYDCVSYLSRCAPEPLVPNNWQWSIPCNYWSSVNVRLLPVATTWSWMIGKCVVLVCVSNTSYSSSRVGLATTSCILTRRESGPRPAWHEILVFSSVASITHSWSLRERAVAQTLTFMQKHTSWMKQNIQGITVETHCRI